MRAIARNAAVQVAQLGPTVHTLNTVKRLVRAFERTAGIDRSVYDNADRGVVRRLAGKSRYFNVTKPVPNESWLVIFNRVAFRNIDVMLNLVRSARARKVERAVRVQLFRKPEDIAGAGGRRSHPQSDPSREVLTHVVDVTTVSELRSAYRPNRAHDFIRRRLLRP